MRVVLRCLGMIHAVRWKIVAEGKHLKHFEQAQIVGVTQEQTAILGLLSWYLKPILDIHIHSQFKDFVELILALNNTKCPKICRNIKGITGD